MKSAKNKIILCVTVIVLLCIPFVCGILVFRTPKNIPKLNGYEATGVKLSELSNSEAMEFIISQNIYIPDGYMADKNLEGFVLNTIKNAEDYPLSPSPGSYTVTVDIGEAIRKAVNEYYGIDGGPYDFCGNEAYGAAPYYGALQIIARDDVTLKPMEGVKFFVGKDDGAPIENENGYYTTDEHGSITFDRIAPESTVIITQVSAPYGYTLDTDTRQAKIICNEVTVIEFGLSEN